MINYPSDLTDKQWQVIKNILEPKARKRKHSLRDILNAMMYITKTGSQWRMLPKDFGPWQTVYFYFRKWKLEGVFEELMHVLRQAVRKIKGKEIKGRKEHIIVDTLGLPMAVRVHAANIHDSLGAVDTIELLKYKIPRLKKIIADGGYRGKLVDVVKEFGWNLSVVLRPNESSKKFKVLPLRWIVERTFSWIENYRRMTTDYEYKTDSAEAMLQITFCQIMLKKLIQ